MKRNMVSLCIILLIVAVSVVVWAGVMKGRFKSIDKEEGVLVFTPEGSHEDMKLPLDRDFKMIPKAKLYEGNDIEVTVEGGVVKRIKPRIGC